MAPFLASNEEPQAAPPPPDPESRHSGLYPSCPAALPVCPQAWPGSGRTEDGVACQEAPSGTALDGHRPVPALGWTEAFYDGEKLVRHAPSYALPGWELGWDPCRER